MPLLSIKRRVGRLEGVFVVDRLQHCPLLTADEIEALADKAAAGQRWSEHEEALVIRQCPIIQGELMITAHGRQVTIKWYRGRRPGRDLRRMRRLVVRQIATGCGR
jgi:hypothetical protein